MDPDDLLREAVQEKRRSQRVWKRILWWAMNRCTRCGRRLISEEVVPDPYSVEGRVLYYHDPVCGLSARRDAMSRRYVRGINKNIYYFLIIAGIYGINYWLYKMYMKM